MKEIVILRALLLFCIIYVIMYTIAHNRTNTSAIIWFNVFIWCIMVYAPTRNVLYISHAIGIFQIATGWIWLDIQHLDIYIKLVMLVWIMLLIRGDCIINQIIKSKPFFYSQTQALISLPILCLFAYLRIINSFSFLSIF
jgi:hypothetical protein